jgi:Prokaryotic cytochrome b561
MSQAKPYQPILLRLLHSVTAILTILALISGFWVYNTFDKRWGSLPLPKVLTIQDIHGTIAVGFLLLLPVFAIYSFRLGARRLLQVRSFDQLKQLNTPMWWISIHHFANTFMLLAATFAVMTGRMMKEQWLPAGELYHSFYTAHLVSWVLVLMSLLFHVLAGAKVGGVPLLLSMVNWKVRKGDAIGPQNIKQEIKQNQMSSILKVVEIMVMGGIILAFILPAFSA